MEYIKLNNEVLGENDSFDTSKDIAAARSYFIDHVNQNTVFFHTLKEKIDYLIEEDYYDETLFERYSFKQIKDVFRLAYAKKFRFKSFMSAYKFYNNYALKTNDKSRYLERYEDRVAVNALFLANGRIGKAKRIAKALINQEYQPATPTFLNAGLKRAGKLVSCFLLDTNDSTEGIFYTITASGQLSRNGGGIGVDLTKLRADGEAIKGIEGAASGVIGVAKLLEQTVNHFNQLGQRNGSLAAYLNIFHADIDAFLDTKKINADENTRLKTLSIAVTIPSKFMELAEKDEPFYVFYPHSVYKEYGVHLADMDMDEWYDKLVDNPNVRKDKKDARKLLVKIAQIQGESGYPYMMFIDNANKSHALSEIGRIKMSNLCSEIFQLQQPSEVFTNPKKNKYGKDISCNLGSLNIVNVMENKSIEEAVSIGMDCLNTVAKLTDIAEVPSVSNANKKLRSVGLGAMNLHGFLAKNFIEYESIEARDFANTFFMMVNYYSIKRSMEIAREENFKFEGFEKSDYATGKYFDKYVKVSYAPFTETAKKLFEGIYIPTTKDWARLAELVKKYGLAHAYRLAIAPTGSISYIQNATASVLPIVERIEKRTYGDSTTIYPMPFLDAMTYYYYKPAYDMSMFKMIDMIATIQQHVDQGISCTLFVKSNETTRDLARYYIYAHKKGLKSLYYTRTKLLTVEECESCAV